MFEKTKRKPYVSCIKLNGAPILPPLITPQKRKELSRDKQQAVKLELRLKNLRDLKANLDNLKKSQPVTTHNKSPSTITFQDNTHIEALGINDNIASKNKKSLNLTRDIFDVTEYSNTGIKIIYSENESNEYKLNHSNNSKDNETDSSLNKSISLESSLTGKNSNSVEIIGNTQNSASPKPRLIRSNSYTLETPSPILIAHLQNNKDGNLNILKNWSSVENNYVPFENSEFSSINTVYHNITDFNGTYGTIADSATNSTRPSNDSVNVNEQKRGHINENKENISYVKESDEKRSHVHEDKSPTIEVFQTDISVQQITVNTVDNQKTTNDTTNKKEMFFGQDAFDFCNPDSQLMQALQEIPEHYSSQIIELLKKQKEEQQQRLERFDNLQNKNTSPRKANPACCTSDNDSSFKNYSSVKSKSCVKRGDNQSTSSSEKLRRSSIFSMSPSQSIYDSRSSSSSNTLKPNNNTASVKLIDLESDSERSSRCSVKKDAKPVPERCSSDIKLPFELSYVDILEESNRSLGISRELFPSKFEIATLNVMKREWAASVIGAYVKGYLIRRLLRTEKVQALIDTIKDALICALQLHNAKNIDEADVELHRRLIQQVSAACYAFHDIFFALTKREQMQLISADRQHKIEKSKRPRSAPSSRRSVSSSRSGGSSQSSVKSSTSGLNTPLNSQSQSLTKV